MLNCKELKLVNKKSLIFTIFFLLLFNQFVIADTSIEDDMNAFLLKEEKNYKRKKIKHKSVDNKNKPVISASKSKRIKKPEKAQQKKPKLYSLTIIANPSFTTIKIMNIKSKYKDGIKLRPGKYKITVTAKGYLSEQETIIIKNKNINKKIKLKRSPSRSSVTRSDYKTYCTKGDKIHKAASKGNYSIVKKCLKVGVSVNTREGNRWTPLHSAASNGRISVMKLLISRGAYVNALDVNGRSPLDHASLRGETQAIKLLRKKGGKRYRY